MILHIHFIFLVIAVITSIVGCQRGNQENNDNQLVTPQQIRDIQGQYLNARGDRLSIGSNGEIQWTQVFAYENGSCRETLVGRLLQFEPFRDPAHPLATMALRFETTDEPHLDGWIDGRQVTFRSRPEMLQACREAFPNRSQRFRQVSPSQMPPLPTPPPFPSREGRMTGARPTAQETRITRGNHGGRAFRVTGNRDSRDQFQPEGISIPISRISQDVMVMALFARSESDFGRINDVFVKNSAFTRPVEDLVHKSLTSSRFTLATSPGTTLSWEGDPINMVLDAESTCGLKISAPLEPSQITYPTDLSLIPNIQFALRLTNTVNVVEDQLSTAAVCTTLTQFMNQVDRTRAIRFETRGRESLVLVTGSDAGLLFHRDSNR